jgi:HPt (histidine-containing phosphotransfer) domain-containing protein
MSNISPDQDIDLSFLEEIADGSNEFMIESIDMFLVNAPAALQTISEAIKIKDWPTVSIAAHKLKPNLGFFGMSVCQGMMQEIELMVKPGNPDVTVLLAEFKIVSGRIADNITSLQKIKLERQAII